MPFTLEEFSRDFAQQVRYSADATGSMVEDAFFDEFCSRLTDCGELDAADRAHYAGRPGSGIRVDGYGGDPTDADGVLTLIALDFDHGADLNTLTRTAMDAAFRRVSKFLERSLDPTWRNALEETAPGFGLADLVSRKWHRVEKVRFFLLTNRQLSRRVDALPAAKLDGREVTYNVWDIRRLHQFDASGREREDMELDLESEYGHCGGSIPLLPAHVPADNGLESYLAVVPGQLIGALFDRWGDRLLEQNVRVFLQARGKVNKGIRNTIDSEASMFFAYNNGITATAEDVTIKSKGGQMLATHIRNLQIVNGGQTAGSIYRAYRDKADLSSIFVQMKLSRIAPTDSSDIVRNISKYANTQNRITAADFFSNHPFHVRMEEFSRRLYAPSPDGTLQQTKWFYERARGQYAQERAKRSPGQLRIFDREHPRRQVITKTDLAKYMSVWNMQPHKVSLGAQKNFASFAGDIGNAWRSSATRFGETYFREVVAKAIVFKATERLVQAAPWYQGGYRANIVAYAIAKLAHDVEARRAAVDFDRTWRTQTLPSAMNKALAVSAQEVHAVLTHPPDGMSNVTEWAKRPLCWDRVKALKIDWPADFLDQLLTAGEREQSLREARRDQTQLDGIAAQTMVFQAGGDFWKSVLSWGASHQQLSPRETSILGIASAIPSRVPTGKQVRVLLELAGRLRENGCPHTLPTANE